MVYLLTLAQRRVQAEIQSAGDGRTAARAGLLMALKANGDGVPMKRLAANLGLGAPALSGLIDRMARDGFVERRPYPADGRAWNIVLTDAGKDLRAEAVRSAKLLNDRLCHGFNETELAIVARWLEATSTNFSRER
jgi:DNA-binding MarR family transcriptional regulator